MPVLNSHTKEVMVYTPEVMGIPGSAEDDTAPVTWGWTAREKEDSGLKETGKQKTWVLESGTCGMQF